MKEVHGWSCAASFAACPPATHPGPNSHLSSQARQTAAPIVSQHLARQWQAASNSPVEL